MAVIQECNLFFQYGLNLIMKSFGERVILIFLVLEMERDVSTQPEQSFGQRLCSRNFLAVRILLEIVEVATPVKDEKFLFVFTDAKYVLAKTGAATNHLHKLNL